MPNFSPVVWDDKPFVRLIIPFALGIVSEAHLRWNIEQLSIACAFVFITLAIWHIIAWYKQRSIHSSLFPLTTFLLLVGLGFLIAQSSISQFHANHFSQSNEVPTSYYCQLTEIPVAKAKSFKAELKLIGAIQNGELAPHRGHILCYFQKDSLSSVLKAGQRILFSATPKSMTSPLNPDEFNYKKYLFGKGIYDQVYLKTNNWTLSDQGKVYGFQSYFANTREYLLAELKKHQVSDEAYGVIAALVLGKKNDLNKVVFDSYASAGAMHVLAVSGLHVGLIYVLIMTLTRPLSRNRVTRFVRFLVVIGIIWFYAGIAGLSASVCRAATMFSFIAWGTTFDKRSSIYNTLAMSALVLMLFHPFIIMEVGFQLSYSAVLGIVFFQPKIFRLWSPSSVILQKVWSLTAVSFSAQLATFPIGMLYFHQFPNYFLVSNLFVIPAATLILYVGIAFFVLHPIEPIADLTANFLNSMVTLLNESIAQMENLPNPNTTGISISIFETYLLYAIILSIAGFLISRNGKWLKGSLALLTFGFAWMGYETIRGNEQSELVVHHIPGYLAITVFDGMQGHFIYSGDLKEQPLKRSFHLQNYWDKMGDADPTWYHIDSLDAQVASLPPSFWYANGVIKTPNRQVRLVNRRWVSQEWRDQHFDALVVFGKQYPKVYDDICSNEADVAWIGGKVNRKMSLRLSDLDSADNWLYARENGALVLN